MTYEFYSYNFDNSLVSYNKDHRYNVYHKREDNKFVTTSCCISCDTAELKPFDELMQVILNDIISIGVDLLSCNADQSDILIIRSLDTNCMMHTYIKNNEIIMQPMIHAMYQIRLFKRLTLQDYSRELYNQYYFIATEEAIQSSKFADKSL